MRRCATVRQSEETKCAENRWKIIKSNNSDRKQQLASSFQSLPCISIFWFSVDLLYRVRCCLWISIELSTLFYLLLHFALFRISDTLASCWTWIEKVLWLHSFAAFCRCCSFFVPQLMCCGLFECKTSAMRWCILFGWYGAIGVHVYILICSIFGCRLGFISSLFEREKKKLPHKLFTLFEELCEQCATNNMHDIVQDIWYVVFGVRWIQVPMQRSRYVRFHKDSLQNSRWTRRLQEKFVSSFFFFLDIVLHICVLMFDLQKISRDYFIAQKVEVLRFFPYCCSTSLKYIILLISSSYFLIMLHNRRICAREWKKHKT